jgi:hypothetical protein
MPAILCRRLLQLAERHDNRVLPLHHSGEIPFQEMAFSLGSQWKGAADTAPDSSTQLKGVEIQVKVPLRDFRRGWPLSRRLIITSFLNHK